MKPFRPPILAVLVLATACGPKADLPGTVHFTIDMAPATSEGWFDAATETVGIRGGTAPLSWNESIRLADPDGDGVYEGAVVFAPEADSAVAYKVKVDGSGNPNDGWETGSNRSFLRGSGDVVRAFDDTTAPLPSTYSGDVRIHEGVGSSARVSARDIAVYLPPGYDDDPERRYPVLYLHDGQNVFDVGGAGSEWHVDEAAERLIAGGEIEPVIIVGVYNTAGRVTEYTPTADSLASERFGGQGGGGGRLYAGYLVEEVKPFVDGAYRTLAGREHTAVGGSSLGGLITMAIGVWHPDVFSGLLVVSPSVRWDDFAILDMVGRAEFPARPRIWLDMGTEEGSGAVATAERLRDALVARGFTVGGDLAFVVDEGAEHTESAWAGRVPDMLRFLYLPR